MTAVEDLQREVEQTGYSEAEVVALRMLAEAGYGPERSAQVLLTARRRGADPVALAGQLIRLRKAMGR